MYQRSGGSHFIQVSGWLHGQWRYSDDDACCKVDVNTEHDQTKFENLQQQNCWTKCTAAPLPGVWQQVWFGRALSKHFKKCNQRTEEEGTHEFLKFQGSSTERYQHQEVNLCDGLLSSGEDSTLSLKFGNHSRLECE